jgi:hypothetical protein
MVSPLFFYQWVLVALWWLCIILHGVWPSGPGAVGSTTLAPPPPRRQRSREPQPVVGLTPKPPCDACVPARAPPTPLEPHPRVSSCGEDAAVRSPPRTIAAPLRPGRIGAGWAGAISWPTALPVGVAGANC